jgi:hypothetical protein
MEAGRFERSNSFRALKLSLSLQDRRRRKRQATGSPRFTWRGGYPGTQAVLFNTLLSLTSPGDVVLTEALTFPGIKGASAKLNVRLVGVAMDGEGIEPQRNL